MGGFLHPLWRTNHNFTFLFFFWSESIIVELQKASANQMLYLKPEEIDIIIWYLLYFSTVVIWTWYCTSTYSDFSNLSANYVLLVLQCKMIWATHASFLAGTVSRFRKERPHHWLKAKMPICVWLISCKRCLLFELINSELLWQY